MKMIKRFWKRIKASWKKLKEKIFGKQYTKKEIFEHLFNWIIKNQPADLTITCICGNKLTHHDLKTEFAKDYVHFMWYCSRDNMTTEKIYSYEMEEIKNM